MVTSGDMTRGKLGRRVEGPANLEQLFSSFPRWEPIPPTTTRGLAEVTARLCRLLRDEVTEQLGLKVTALAGLEEDWRNPIKKLTIRFTSRHVGG